MAAHMTEVLGCEGFNIVQNNGPLAGQTVFHFHIHLILSLIHIFLIILYVGISSPGFLDILYHNPLGTVIMSVCLLIYGVSFYMGKKLSLIHI